MFFRNFPSQELNPRPRKITRRAPYQRRYDDTLNRIGHLKMVIYKMDFERGSLRTLFYQKFIFDEIKIKHYKLMTFLSKYYMPQCTCSAYNKLISSNK